MHSHRTVVALWLVLAALLGVSGLLVGMQTMIPGPASKEALMSNPGEQIAFASGIPPRDFLFAILKHPHRTPVDPIFRNARDALVQTLRAEKDPETDELLFSKVETTGHTQLDDDTFLSSDPHQLLITGETTVSIDRAAAAMARFPDSMASFREKWPEFELRYLSSGTADAELFDLIHRDLDRSLVYTLPLTFAVLIWAFGSLLSALLPLFIALVSLCASLGAAALLSHAFGAINATASQLVVLLVLALGVDYSLFILSRVRDEKRGGRTHAEAIAIARRTAGISIVWSGLTVSLSLVGLFLMNDTILRSMAVVSIVAVFITFGSCVLVLPSILSLAERRITPARKSVSDHTLLRAWLGFSIRRPGIVLLFVGGAVLGVALCSTQLELGSTIEPGLLPKSLESSQTFATLERNFPKFSGTDFSVIIRGRDLESAQADEKIQAFVEDLQEHHNAVRGPVALERNAANDVARISFVFSESPNNPSARSLVDDLRARLFTKYFPLPEYSAYISGTLPFVIDDSRRYSERTPLVFQGVLGLSMIFLLIAFRSLVVPIKAVLLNILSAGASFGVLVIVFQFLEQSAWHYSVIEGFVPALLFSILFGLSMDYHILLLSRIQEAVREGHSTNEAVAIGIHSTSGAITSAALIMVSVFAVVACLELPVMKELGLGLAVAVLVDATLIRCMLLPASMVMLGRWNWYFPRWLSWLPAIEHR